MRFILARWQLIRLFASCFTLFACATAAGQPTATLIGEILDDSTSLPLAGRVYLRNAEGQFLLVQSVQGTAVPYEKRRSNTSIEVHTSVSAHPFSAKLPAGAYTVVVERGKEYFPSKTQVALGAGESKRIRIRLRRWVNMAAAGWYSGETHVHRDVSELPTLQLAEDLNVAFPLTAWVTDSEATPATHNKNRREVPPAQLVHIDDTHVFWPVNTEYEIFSVRGKRHTLGAVFVLNHQSALQLPAPPVKPIAAEARRQGAVLELDKHNWPWSMMLVPQMKVDLFELANNHMWRTEFLFTDWYPEYVGSFMDVEMVDGQFTERGWIQFGLENYYALLNCGFPMMPTAGTASGVHPVPLGFGRVYVQLKDGFDYKAWLKGLLAGNSFVTTGPMLTVKLQRQSDRLMGTGSLQSLHPPKSLEVIVNGRVAKTLPVTSAPREKSGCYLVPVEVDLPVKESGWIAVRAFCETTKGQIRFAHTAPVHFTVADQPLRPSQEQRDYLIRRVADEIDRNRGTLSVDALKEFEQALRRYQSIEAR